MLNLSWDCLSAMSTYWDYDLKGEKLTTDKLNYYFNYYCLRLKAEDLGITWVVVVVLGFFVWSLHYQLQPPCFPFIFTYISPSPLSLTPFSTYVNLPSSTYLPLPIHKNQYIIATEPGDGIGLVIIIIFIIIVDDRQTDTNQFDEFWLVQFVRKNNEQLLPGFD